MSPIRFAGALVVSIALIGGALWFRFIRVPTYSAPLVTVTEPAEFASDDAYLKDFLAASSTKHTVSTTTPSQVDLVSRQMFSDYMSLKSAGQVTPDNIKTLADKYAESIKNIDIPKNTIGLNQLIIVPDSETNLVAYGDTISAIHLKYKNLVTAQYGGGALTDITSSAFSTFMRAVAELYRASVKELLLVKTPQSLAQIHLDLINNYSESVEIMKLVSNASKDPAKAYAALNLYTKNAKKEIELYSKIKATLQANGIIFDTTI